ncbi:MAG: hypothetical protein PHR20_08805 [Bacteroidales bacterium]|nr:hypothetical protein [Bacteroidales bacterium]
MNKKILSHQHNSKFLSAPHIPYKGNKAAIAQQLCEAMPQCNHFLDACCGGGSIGLTMLANVNLSYGLLSMYQLTNRKVFKASETLTRKAGRLMGELGSIMGEHKRLKEQINAIQVAQGDLNKDEKVLKVPVSEEDLLKFETSGAVTIQSDEEYAIFDATLEDDGE